MVAGRLEDRVRSVRTEPAAATHVYTINVDGTGQTRLTSTSTYDDHPSWSPDGRRIVFKSYRDDPTLNESNLYVMNADGSGQTALTSGPDRDTGPAWSPRGDKIAFSRCVFDVVHVRRQSLHGERGRLRRHAADLRDG